MTVHQPKATGGNAQDSWAFDITNEINNIIENGISGGGAGVKFGATLPLTGSDGEAFILLGNDGTNLPGYYFMYNGNWVAQSTAPQGDSVTGLTGSFSDDGILTLTPEIAGIAQAPIVSNDLTGPQGPRGQDYTLLSGTVNTVPTLEQFNGADVVYVYVD